MKNVFKIIFSMMFLAPLFVLAGQYDAIETEIFDIQKGFITDIAKTLQIESFSGSRQTGNMNLTTKFDADDMIGTLSLKLDPYTIVADTKTGNSEMQYRGKIEFDVKEKNTQDSTHFLKGYVDFDVSLTQAEGDMYIRLLSLDGTLSGDPDGKEQFDSMMTESKKYIGKTYKITNKQNFQPEDIYNLIKNGYSLLSTSPLFTVVSKNQDGSYRLRMNASTLEKLGINNPEKDKTLIIYKNTRGKKEIRIMPKPSSPMNHITLSDNLGKKTLSGRMFDNISYSKSDMRFSVSKDMFSLTINEQDSNIKALWRDNTLAIVLKQLKTEYQDELSIAATGQLSPDLRTMNLNLMWNGKKIGNLSSSVGGNTTNYKMNLSIQEALWNIIVDLSGSYSETRGDYNIIVPTVYEIIN